MEKTSEIEKFLAEAFCIDGNCDFQGLGELKSRACVSTVTVFNLQDSKRCNFTITLSMNVKTRDEL